VIVPQSEINLINGKMRRRMMRVPVRYREDGSREPSPVAKGRAYKLQRRRGVKSDATITVTSVERQKLGAISERDARREGYASIQGALQAWGAQHGDAHPDRLVWVIEFVRGDLSEQYEAARPLLLARTGNYTHSPSLAVSAEPEVIDPEAAERMAAESRRHRAEAQRQSVEQMANHVGALREAIADMKVRQLLQRAARTLEQAAKLLPSDATVDLAGLLQMGSDSASSRPPRGASSATPESEAA
jgi:hypothetical protein